MAYCKRIDVTCLTQGVEAKMPSSRISGHVFVEDPNLSFDVEHVIWKEGARRQKDGVLLFIDDEIVDQSNMNSAIESVILAYGDRVKALVGRGVRARLVMGFFFDTSKVAAFGFDLSEKTLSSLAQLGLGVTLDVFPCSELED